MASIWYGIGISIGIALTGWFFSPMISFILNKILSYLYDASKKVPGLVADTIPDLKNALREVEEQWMLKKLSPEKSSGVFTLERLESLLKSLKAALYEMEDTVDLIDYHLIEDKARGEPQDTTWLQWCLCNPILETSALALERVKQSWLGRSVHIVGERLAALWHCVQTIVHWLGRWTRRSGAHLPIYSACPSSWDFKNFLRAIINWFSETYASAKDNRDWSNKNAGFTRYEQDVDCTIMGPLCTPLKENMKRIEKLFDEASKCTSFTRRVQETIEQPDQQRINGSGNITSFTDKVEHVTAYPAMKVTGRDKVREQIRAILHDLSSSENVIGICGVPGSGKTTLAQYVYQSEKEGGHFDLVMWIHVSENFSVDVIFRRMFEEASPNEETACPPFNSLNALLTKLVNKLNGKRLLLVLDDIWSNEVLPQLVSPFKVGRIGSKILVTSRTDSALEHLGPDVRYKILPIPPLDDRDFFELLMYYACVDTRDQCGSQLHAVGGEIAKQLKGSPLAARLVGGILGEKRDLDFWRTIQDRELLNETTGADLWWCYRHLDEHIRRCFAFCSIFPRGLPLYRADLVNLWVAAGFTGTGSTNKGKEMEDVGEEYFRKLLSTSFLQPGGMCQGRDYYLVHDLLHDLAKEVAGSEYFTIENDMRQSGEEQIRSSLTEVPRDVRHLFVQNYKGELIIGKILELEKLRTLIIYNVGWNVLVEDKVLKSIFQRLQKLRILAIAFNFNNDGINLICGAISVPESVTQSKHLRYLAFRSDWKSRVTFPSTPSRLYHLWLLDVGCAKHLNFSGGGFTNLRHVISDELTRFGNERLKVLNMGKMPSLQTLPCFCVSKEQRYGVIQLRDLNKLRGSLSVSGLENVRSKVEALEANLATKERLRELKLEWKSAFPAQVDLEIEAEVLEGLCPPIGLETLIIIGYSGLRYPSWMLGKQNGGPKYLKKLVFSRGSQQGPPPQIKAFIHLQSLELSHCSWNALPDNMEDLTSLKLLLIERCLRIMSLPTLPQSIEEFTQPLRCWVHVVLRREGIFFLQTI